MKITKKEIKQKTVSYRGTGFSPAWGFTCHIGPGLDFSKGSMHERVLHDQSGQSWPATTKADFVNVIYEVMFRGNDKFVFAD